ncbi:MAG: GTPase [Chloroflexi bacterium]|nr:GTPase [Chloroflexota bacterium]
MLRARLPVLAVCAVRTGAGKSPASQWIVQELRKRGWRVSVLRHPMPYGDLAKQAVQRFASREDLDVAETTIEEREEYEPYVRIGVPVYAGVDYEPILRMAEKTADVLLWDGGNNDFPFVRPDLLVTLVDPLRPGHEVAYHPGETNLRMADVVLISKASSAAPDAMATVRRNIAQANPKAEVIEGDLVPTVDWPELVRGKRVLIVGDGPTLTHGGMPHGAGTLIARELGATIVAPRSVALGELRETLARFPHIDSELPAMGYSQGQLDDLKATLEHAGDAVIVDASPVDLGRLLSIAQPMVNVTYGFRERDGGLTRALDRFEQKHLQRRKTV